MANGSVFTVVPERYLERLSQTGWQGVVLVGTIGLPKVVYWSEIHWRSTGVIQVFEDMKCLGRCRWMTWQSGVVPGR
jgi:hypothetical protein